MSLAEQMPAPPEGELTQVIIGVMLGMGLLMLVAFVARAPREWSR